MGTSNSLYVISSSMTMSPLIPATSTEMGLFDSGIVSHLQKCSGNSRLYYTWGHSKIVNNSNHL